MSHRKNRSSSKSLEGLSEGEVDSLSEEDATPFRVIYVSNLDEAVVEMDLKFFAQRAGDVRAVEMRPRKDRPGTAFVEFYSSENAKSALQKLGGELLLGKHVTVEPARNRASLLESRPVERRITEDISTLFIKKIPPRTPVERIVRAFEPFGVVCVCEQLVSEVFAFLEFEDSEVAERILEDEPTIYIGKTKISVVRSKSLFIPTKRAYYPSQRDRSISARRSDDRRRGRSCSQSRSPTFRRVITRSRSRSRSHSRLTEARRSRSDSIPENLQREIVREVPGQREVLSLSASTSDLATNTSFPAVQLQQQQQQQQLHQQSLPASMPMLGNNPMAVANMMYFNPLLNPMASLLMPYMSMNQLGLQPQASQPQPAPMTGPQVAQGVPMGAMGQPFVGGITPQMLALLQQQQQQIMMLAQQQARAAGIQVPMMYQPPSNPSLSSSASTMPTAFPTGTDSRPSSPKPPSS